MPINLKQAAEQAGIKPLSLEEAARSAGVQPLQQPTSSVKFPGFLERARESVRRRTATFEEAVDAFGAGKQPLDETALQVTGQAAGLGLDIFGDVLLTLIKGAGKGLSAITPDIIEKPVVGKLKEGVKRIKEESIEPLIASTKNTAEAFKTQFPEKANRLVELAQDPRVRRNLGALANLIETTLLAKAPARRKDIGARIGAGLETRAEKQIAGKLQSEVRELVSPIRTKKVKELQVPRSTETGRGAFIQTQIAPTAQELAAEQAILRIPNFQVTKSMQRNYNAIQVANEKAAISLKKQIAANNFIISKKEVKSRLNEAKTVLSESPTIVGDAEKTADKLMNKMVQLINQNAGTGSGVLKARKEYDSWVRLQKPKAFDASAENAFSIANREIRNTLNDILEEKTKNVAVKESLQNQRALFTAMDNVVPKAAAEADTAFLRSLDRLGAVIGTKSKIVQVIAAGVGIGGLGAAATFATPALIAGGLGLLIFKGGKLIASPKTKQAVSRLLKEINKLEPSIQQQFVGDIEILEALLRE